MRRGLAGLFFFIAAILLALAAGGWWMQRVVFSPTTSRDVAREVLQIDAVRGQLATVVAGAASDAMDTSPGQLGQAIDTLARNPAAAEVFAEIVADAHAKVIGTRSEPVTITGQQMVHIVRDQRVAELPTVTIEVDEVGYLRAIGSVLEWFVPITAIAGAVMLVLGIVAHPRKADALFGIGVFCVVAAVLALVFGYTVPAFAVSAISDNTWLDVIPAVAQDQFGLIAGTSVAMAVIGVALVIGTVGVRRRKAKGWSSPVRVGRYSNEQRRWS